MLEFDQCWPESLLYNTEVFKGKTNSWRMKKRSVAKREPTLNEISHLSSTRGKYWNRYDERWVCPCCERIKIECVRASKKNPWVLEIKKVPLFNSEKKAVDYESSPMCADCIDSVIHLGREALILAGSDAVFPSSVITLQELSSIILPRPYSRHALRNDLIDNMLPSIIERCSMFFGYPKNS